MKEAEQFAAEDPRDEGGVDIRNQATRWSIRREDPERDGRQDPRGRQGQRGSALGKLKETLKGTDTQAIKNATEELTKAFYAVSEKLYGQQGGQAGQPGPDMGGQAQQGGTSAGPDVVDARL